MSMIPNLIQRVFILTTFVLLTLSHQWNRNPSSIERLVKWDGFDKFYVVNNGTNKSTEKKFAVNNTLDENITSANASSIESTNTTFDSFETNETQLQEAEKMKELNGSENAIDDSFEEPESDDGNKTSVKETEAESNLEDLEETENTTETGSTEDRIIGGKNVPDGKYSFIIQANGCGASLISPDRILTAAHCKDIMGSVVYIHRIAWSGGQKLTVTQKWVHPGGDGYDALVAQISPPVKDIKPIYLDSGKKGVSDPGKINTVIGWGDTSQASGNQIARVLQEMSGPILSQDSCKNMCNNGWWPYDSEICMQQNKGQEIGAGDSGSPMFYNEGERYVQTGIVHGGNECGKYGIYTRVSEISDWILSHAPDAQMY